MKQYPKYNVPEIRDFKHLLKYAAETFGENTAFWYSQNKEDVKKSFNTLCSDVKALATYFNSNGEKEEKIAVFGENSYEWIITYLSTVNAERIIVPIDKELGKDAVKNLINDSGVTTVIFGKTKKKVLDEISNDEIPSVSKMICFDDLYLCIAEGAELIENGDTYYDDSVVDIEKMCSIIYTSGTTGTPKGVMLSQKNLVYDMSASSSYLFIPANKILLLPLHHSFGWTACVTCMIYRGYSVYINKSLKTILPDIKKSQPGHICLVPLFIEKFYKNIWKNVEDQGKTALLKKMISISNGLRKVGIDLRHIFFKSIRDAFGGKLEMLISGGAAIDKTYIDAFDDFGIQIIEGFGITECSPIVSINRNKYFRYGSVGVAIPESEVKIVNPDENNEGEILVKGDHVTLGYYNNPSATEDAFEDGWFKTGDIGKIDEDGFIFITGRKKNIIILSNGKNVYPEEIETEFLKLPYVDEVIVFGRDDLLCAEIYTESKDKKEEIKNSIKELNKTLPSYKQVKHVEFRDTEFEKTTTKKIKRY